jgi:PAS domain S-box-containing protein
LEDKTYSESQARLEEAWKEIAYYKRLSKEAGDLRLRETEELSRLIAKLKKAEKELEQAKDELEQRVEERTADLSKANIALTREISERKQVEEALWESRQQFQGLVETLYDWVWEVSPEGRYTYISPRIKDILGYEPEEVIGKSPFEMMPAEEWQRVSEIFETLRAEQKPITSLENINLHKDGHPVIMETSALPFYDSKGNFKGYRGTDRDITKRKQEEEELQESEAKYRFLTEMMNDIVWTMDMNLEMVYVSPSIEKALGFSREEHLARSISEQVTPESMSLIEKIVAKELLIEQEGKADPERTLNVQVEYYHKDGGTRWFEHVIGGIRNDQGMLTGIHGVARDITERKATEKARQESEQRMRLALEGTDQGCWEFDLLSKRVTYSDNWHKILGYSHDEAIFDYEWWISQIHPASSTVFEKALLDYMSGHTNYLEWEYQIRDKSGDWQWIHALGIFTDTDGSGFPVRMIGTHRNITERKRMEEDLLRAHKLESLGILAGGIAHDFNNLMGIVQGYIDLALLDLPPDHVSHRRLLTAMRGVEQTKDLTSRLITFSRGGGPVRQICDLAEMVRKAVLRTIKGTEVEVMFNFADNLWTAEVDELQMTQVFNNLTKNALEAMEEGGKLTIKTENAFIASGEVPDLREGSYIRIIFADEGHGIPEAHLAKIFDPYFTTKGMGAKKGMGLGLSVCHSVLTKHGGQITVKSQFGAGTSFSLYLPTPTDMPKVKEVETLSSTVKVRVLIMDDEPHICHIERAYLERMGYEVTDVGDGQKAIDAYTRAIRSGTPFDLVFLDLTVRQGMGGQLAMERLMKIDPAVKAIIASGYLDDPVIENYEAYGFRGALKKPFNREELESILEKILHR